MKRITTIHIKKLDDSSEIEKIELKLRKIIGIKKLNIDMKHGIIEFYYDMPITLHRVFEVLKNEGCKLSGCYNYLKTTSNQKELFNHIYLKV